jgi:HAD superfamily hydrolase (TIGR01509 family)
LVIFDCDGVLVDSERITNTVFADMLGELGLRMSLADMFEHFVGRAMPQNLAKIEQMLGRPVPEGFTDELRQRCLTPLQRELRPVVGVDVALSQLSELRIPFCVASSGDHMKMKTTLGITGLLPHFEGRLFSVTEVARPKPYPDVFLHAASRMGVRPERTVVVEDTSTGVEAAVSAGMRAFGFAEMTSVQRLMAAGAFLTFTEMRQLPTLIRGTGDARPHDR